MGCGNSCRDGSTQAVRAPRRYPDPCEHAAGSGSHLLHGNGGAVPGSDPLTGQPRYRACPGNPERGGSVSRRLRRAGKGPGPRRRGRAGARRGRRSPGRGRRSPAGAPLSRSPAAERVGDRPAAPIPGAPAGRAATEGILRSVRGTVPCGHGNSLPSPPVP